MRSNKNSHGFSSCLCLWGSALPHSPHLSIYLQFLTACPLVCKLPNQTDQQQPYRDHTTSSPDWTGPGLCLRLLVVLLLWPDQVWWGHTLTSRLMLAPHLPQHSFTPFQHLPGLRIPLSFSSFKTILSKAIKPKGFFTGLKEKSLHVDGHFTTECQHVQNPFQNEDISHFSLLHF